MSKNDAFLAKLEQWANKTEKKLTAVIQNSIEDMVEYANTPVDDGGRMPVKTGFLRQSGAGEVNQIPSGESEKEKGVTYSYKPGLSALPRFKLGDTFYYGWCAIYANVQNIRFGFKDLAVQKWPDIVANNVRRLKK